MNSSRRIAIATRGRRTSRAAMTAQPAASIASMTPVERWAAIAMIAMSWTSPKLTAAPNPTASMAVSSGFGFHAIVTSSPGTMPTATAAIRSAAAGMERSIPDHIVDRPSSVVIAKRVVVSKSGQDRPKLVMVVRTDEHVGDAKRTNELRPFGWRFGRVEEWLLPVPRHSVAEQPVVVAEQTVLVDERGLECRKDICLLR